jgi:glycosyltransferase involved in cell wall biosynthesis
MKMVFVSNYPLPYHTPILNALADRVDLHVIFMSRGHALGDTRGGAYVDQWGVEPRFPYEFHWSRALRSRRSDFRMQYSFGVTRKLLSLRPDVIFFNSWGPLVLEPLLWKLASGRRAVMWAESTRYSGLMRGRLSNLFRRMVLAQVDAYVTNGTQATKYLRDLGVKPEVVVTSCLPSEPRGVPEAFRATRAAASGKRFLFVGRLVPLKRPVELTHTFRQLLKSEPDAQLTIVGDGPLRTEVEKASHGTDAVRLLGRLEGANLAPIYASHDVLVVPSVREVWGLVVNEALAYGLHVVASDQVGSAHDLVNDQIGTLVPADDWAAMLAALKRATHLDNLPSRRRAARETIQRCSAAAFAADLHRAAEIAVAA